MRQVRLGDTEVADLKPGSKDSQCLHDAQCIGQIFHRCALGNFEYQRPQADSPRLFDHRKIDLGRNGLPTMVSTIDVAIDG